MRAAIYHEFAKPLIIKNVPDPTPTKHGVVLGVKATGLCRNDWKNNKSGRIWNGVELICNGYRT